MTKRRCPQADSLARRLVREARARARADASLAPLRVQRLLDLHDEAGMAALLLVMSAVTLLPITGVGTVLSLGILAWAWSWARQHSHLVGLERIAQMPVPLALADRVLRGLSRLHLMRSRWMRARWLNLQTPFWRWLWALWIACMAVVILLPVPFGNFLPAVSLVMFSLGLMARDGLLLLLSLLPGAGGLVVLGASAHLIVAAWGAFKIPGIAG